MQSYDDTGNTVAKVNISEPVPPLGEWNTTEPDLHNNMHREIRNKHSSLVWTYVKLTSRCTHQFLGKPHLHSRQNAGIPLGLMGTVWLRHCIHSLSPHITQET